MYKLLSQISEMPEHLITLWSMIGTVVAAVVTAFSLVIYAVIYKAQLRHLKWSANQELMKALMDLDKLIIQHPEYHWMVWPTERSPPPSSDVVLDDPCARGLLYFHLNMFDMAHGYYTRILRYSTRRLRLSRDRHEEDDWEGWKVYIRNFMVQDYAATVFQREGELWFSPEFVKFVGQLIAEGQRLAKTEGSVG
jgi:hypothetical protein